MSNQTLVVLTLSTETANKYDMVTWSASFRKKKKKNQNFSHPFVFVKRSIKWLVNSDFNFEKTSQNFYDEGTGKKKNQNKK